MFGKNGRDNKDLSQIPSDLGIVIYSGREYKKNMSGFLPSPCPVTLTSEGERCRKYPHHQEKLVFPLAGQGMQVVWWPHDMGELNFFIVT